MSEVKHSIPEMENITSLCELIEAARGLRAYVMEKSERLHWRFVGAIGDDFGSTRCLVDDIRKPV